MPHGAWLLGVVALRPGGVRRFHGPCRNLPAPPLLNRSRGHYDWLLGQTSLISTTVGSPRRNVPYLARCRVSRASWNRMCARKSCRSNFRAGSLEAPGKAWLCQACGAAEQSGAATGNACCSERQRLCRNRFANSRPQLQSGHFTQYYVGHSITRRFSIDRLPGNGRFRGGV